MSHCCDSVMVDVRSICCRVDNIVMVYKLMTKLVLLIGMRYRNVEYVRSKGCLCNKTFQDLVPSCLIILLHGGLTVKISGQETYIIAIHSVNA